MKVRPKNPSSISNHKYFVMGKIQSTPEPLSGTYSDIQQAREYLIMCRIAFPSHKKIDLVI